MRRILLPALLLCFIPLTSHGFGINNPKYTLTVTYRTMYDNNVLNYSSYDRDRFRNNTDPKPSPIETLDDIRSDFKLSATMYFNLIGKRKTRIQATGDVANYLKNPVNNFGWFNLSLRQDIIDQLRVLIYYFDEPHYFIRNYVDIHTGIRRECDFEMEQWLLKTYYRPSKLIEIVGSIRMKKYAYNKYFTEYDSDYLEYGSEVIYRYSKWRISAGYALGISDNIGFDNLLNVSGVSFDEDRDEGEADFEQDIFDVSIRRQYRAFNKKMAAKIEGSLEMRYYLTERDPALDPMHHGRRDLNQKIAVSNSIEISKPLDLELGVAFKSRDSKASSSIVDKFKDYNRMTCWVEFSYQIN